MAKRLKILRITRRTKDAVKEIDYVDQLSDTETQWMEIFLAGYYGNDTEAQAALTSTAKDARAFGRAAGRENNAYSRDMSNKFVRLSLKSETEIGDEADCEEFPTMKSSEFHFYKCTRCLKKADGCRCPSKQRNKPYGIEDWAPAVTSPETAYAEAEEALNTKAYDLLPYGDNPPAADLIPGRKVVICLPHHYLKDRPGTVQAYRVWTNEYLIEAERAGLKHRDGTMSSTTLCWVKPAGLKLFKPSLASKHKDA